VNPLDLSIGLFVGMIIGIATVISITDKPHCSVAKVSDPVQTDRGLEIFYTYACIENNTYSLHGYYEVIHE